MSSGRIEHYSVRAEDGGLARWLPGLRMLRSYDVSWLRNDVVAGVVLTTMLVPVGIAYAEASGVPGIYGLYATIVPLLAYAVFGPSRILVLGPDSSLAAVILAVVAPLSAGDPERAIEIAAMMAFVSGAICVIAGLARLGFITELLSKPIRYGYMNGIALTVLLSQTPKLLGFKIDADGPAAPGMGDHRANRRRPHERRRARDRRRRARADPSAEALPTRAGNPDRGGRRHADRRDIPSRRGRPRRERRRVRARDVAAGLAEARDTTAAPRRSGAAALGRRGRRAGLVRRHERAVARVCRALAHAGGP
jgi:hypothetical protein